jgi:hypothetical protein
VIAETPQAATMSPVRQVAGIVLIFMGVGPPVGGLVFLVGRWMAAVASEPVSSGNWLKTIAFALMGVVLSAFAAIAAAPYSYLYGIGPAAVAGLVIGILRLQHGRLNTSTVLVVGGGVGIASSLVLSRLMGVAAYGLINPLSGFDVTDYVLYALSCMAATFVSWGLARSFPA